MKHSSTPSPQNIRWHSAIPNALSNRLDLTGNLFYPLPPTLANLLDRQLAKTIGRTAVSDERDIADIADQRDAVAFRDSVAVQYRYLIDRRPPLTLEILRDVGSKEPVKALEELGPMLSHDFRYSQAYCGWLISQEEYWNDLEELVSEESDGSSLLPAPKPAILGGSEMPVANKNQAADANQYKQLFEKWRLQTLETHDLPVCISPQLTGTTVYNPDAPAGTINPVIPDIFPIDGKGMIDKSLEAAIRSVHAPHLDSWKDLICSSSRTKKRLDTYSRRFVLQHYWRVLTQRYAEQLARKVMTLNDIFAEYFNVSADMIKSDRSELDMLLERRLSTQ